MRDLIAEESLKIRLVELNNVRKSAKFSIAIEFDGWKSISGADLLAIVATLPNGRCFILDLQDITAINHNAKNLADLVVKFVREAKINFNLINSIVTDGAPAYNLARTTICEIMLLPLPIEYRCMAHLLSLIGERMSKSHEISATIERAVALANTVSRHRILASRLASEGARKIIHVVAARWYSTSNSLNSVLALKETLSRMPIVSELAADQWFPILADNEFWIDLREISEYFNDLSSYIDLAEPSNSLLSDCFRNLLEFARFCMRKPEEDRVRCIALCSFSFHFS